MKGVLRMIVCVFIVGVLINCGGGGGGTTSGPAVASVSGVAAAGAPLRGLVWLKDAGGVTRGPTTLDINGTFSFDTAGLTPPFYLKALGAVGGESYELYSITLQGTGNINPLTNVIAAAAAHVTDPKTAYDNPADHPVTRVDLRTATADMVSLLRPMLDAYNAPADPVTGPYTADHTGLDGVLDVVGIDLSPTTGSVTVRNRLTGSVIASGNTGSLSAPTQALVDVPDPQAVTDLRDIEAKLAEFVAVKNGKGAGLTAADLEPFFATDYGIHDGSLRSSRISALAASWANSLPITAISGLVIKEKIGTDYRVVFDTYLSDGSMSFLPTGGFVYTKEAGVWKARGNGKRSFVYLHAGNWRSLNPDGSVSQWAGLRIIAYDYSILSAFTCFLIMNLTDCSDRRLPSLFKKK